MKRRGSIGFFLCFLGLTLLQDVSGQGRSLDEALARADSVIRIAVEKETIPGAVFLVAKNGSELLTRAYGYAHLYNFERQKLSEPEVMTDGHLFDLASLTKVMATTFGVMLLVDQDRIDLDLPVYRYLPSFSGSGKDSVTVRRLLTHTAGLFPWKPLYYHATNAEETLDYISRLPLAYAVGKERHYSDLGFMLVGYLVERVSGRPLDVFLEENLYGPLNLQAICFSPLNKGPGPVAATSFGNPYERRMVADDSFGYVCDEDPDFFTGWRERVLIGEVNDGNAHYAHNGVAGHAGLFATAGVLKVLLDVLLGHGEVDGRRLISADVVKAFLTKDRFGNGLGWGMSPAVLGIEDPPEGTFGHSGFTGTYVAAFPEYDLSIILLTNRQHVGLQSDGYYPSMAGLRRQVVSMILEAFNPAD